MPISPNTNYRQVKKVCRHACLLEIVHSAIVIRGVIGRLGSDNQDRHLGQINELLRWISLKNAVCQVGTWRRGPNDGRKVRSIRSSGGIILHRQVGDTIRVRPKERENTLEWRTPRLECNYLLDEVGASIADSPAQRSSLAVGEGGKGPG